MGRNVRTDSVSDVDTATTVGGLRLSVLPQGDTCVVRASGELDHASRDQLFAASTAGDHRQMSIDLSGVSFMDCSGYGALVASRLRIEGDGRTLTISGVTGQPKHLIELIEQLESDRDPGIPVPATTGYQLSMLGTRASRRQGSPQVEPDPTEA